MYLSDLNHSAMSICISWISASYFKIIFKVFKQILLESLWRLSTFSYKYVSEGAKQIYFHTVFCCMCEVLFSFLRTHMLIFHGFLGYKSLLFILGKHTITHRKIFLNSLFIKKKKRERGKCFSSRSESYSIRLSFKNAVIKVIISKLI